MKIDPVIQPKLKIGPANDHYEQEADAMADRVVQLPQMPLVQKSPEEEELQMKPLADSARPIIRKKEEEEESLQMKGFESGTIQRKEGEVSPEVSNQLSQSKGSGAKLPKDTNAFMGNAFGTDFSKVNIHTGAGAIQMNRSLGARAFTHGNDVYFNQGEYRPSSRQGKHLLAHELTHVVQQGGVGMSIQRKPGDAKDLKRLRTILAYFDVPETEVTTIFGSLSKEDSNTALYSETMKGQAVGALNNYEMYIAMRYCDGDLEKRLEWMVEEGSDWEYLKDVITSSREDRSSLLSNNILKAGFVSAIGDEAMAEAVKLIGGKLKDKLAWVAAEGSDENLIFSVISTSPSSEYKEAADDAALMSALKRELNSSEFDNVKKMLTNGIPEIAATDTAMGAAIVEATEKINRGHTATSGVHYSHNYRSRAKMYDNDRTEVRYKPYYDFWKEEYTSGYTNPTYWKKVGSMRWELKPGKSASEAVKSWIKGLTIAECFTALVAIQLDTYRKAIGDVRFDKRFSSAYGNKPARSLSIKIGSTSSLSGSYGFNTASHLDVGTIGARNAKEGEWHYFYNHPAYLLKHPAGAFQGENAIYMGEVSGVQMWSGLGVTSKSEMNLLGAMANAYNGGRTNRDYWWIVNKFISKQGFNYNKDYESIYTANLDKVSAEYKESGGYFPTRSIDASAILSAPAQRVKGKTRKGGMFSRAGKGFDYAEVERQRNK